MAVLDVKEIWSGRRGAIDDKSVREYTRVFRLITTDTFDGPATILAVFLQVIFSTYADANGFQDSGAVLRRVSPQQDSENPFLWQVVCDYSSESADPQFNLQNPIDRPPHYQWSGQKFAKPVVEDTNGNTLKASNNEPYPPEDIDDTRRTLTVTRFEATFPDDLADRFQDTLNSGIWLGKPAKTVKCELITGETAFENNVSCWQVRYEFAIRKSKVVGVDETAWQKRLVDEGSYYLVAGARTIADVNGVPRPTPIQLDGSGGLLGVSAAQHFKSFDMYPTADFAELNIPVPP